jgi:hypothetical protein
MIPGLDYGYGIFVEPFYDLTLRQHGGNIWGWGSQLVWHPERRFAVAVLANTFSSLSNAAYCIADHVLEPDHSVDPDFPVDPDRWPSLRGRSSAASISTLLGLVQPLSHRGQHHHHRRRHDAPQRCPTPASALEPHSGSPSTEFLDVFFVDVDG